MKTIINPIAKGTYKGTNWSNATSIKEARTLLLKPELEKRNKMRISVGLSELSHADYINIVYKCSTHDYFSIPLTKEEYTKYLILRTEENKRIGCKQYTD